MNRHEVPSCYGSNVKNTKLGLRIGSITYGTNPTLQPIISLSEFIAKQFPCRPDSFLKQRPCVRTSWPEDPVRFTVPAALSKQLYWCANPHRLKTRRLGNNLPHCGGPWQNKLNLSFRMEITKVHLTVKRVPSRPDSSFLQELRVKHLWPYIKMMVLPMRSTPLCPLPKLLCWFAIQDQPKTEKLESNLCRSVWKWANVNSF